MSLGGTGCVILQKWANRAELNCAELNRAELNRAELNRAELNRAGPAVQTMLAWFGPAHFSSVL